MRAGMRVLLLVAATICVSCAQTNNSSNDSKQPPPQPQQPQQQPQPPPQQQPQQQQQQRSIWDEPIRFSTKTKDACTMVVSGAKDYTRLRVSCKGPSQGQTPGRSYYCDFQGKPNLCGAYNLNPRHYFTQMMWEMRKLTHACQGPRVYRPLMCKKHPDEVQMTSLASSPKAATPKPSKPMTEQRKAVVPVQTKPSTTPKPVKPQPIKPQPGKAVQTKKPSAKPGKTTTRPTEQPESRASRMAKEYCWKSFHGVCSYFISWFRN